MYALDPTMPVLLRPDGSVQVGWDPRRAVVVRPPSGVSSAELVPVLRAMASPVSREQLQQLAGRSGLDEEAVDELLESLTSRGVVRTQRNSSARTLSIRVHGVGPLSTLLADGLRCSGARVVVTGHGNAGSGADLMVLADALGTDPRLLRELHAGRVPHLPVRVRDGVGLVGPLVIPGVTSCLSCADLHRTDRDAAWPALAAQLRHEIGCADRPTLLATAALALGQLLQIIAGVRGPAGAVPPAPPSTWNTTWEVDVASHTLLARRWPRHPLCACWNSQLSLTRSQG